MKTQTTQAAKTQTKAATKAPAKTASKAPAKTASKARGVYAAILIEALAGQYGDLIKRFYVSAVSYHKVKKTAFPRQRLAQTALLSAPEFRDYLTARKSSGLPAGDVKAQRAFDEMAQQAPALFK